MKHILDNSPNTATPLSLRHAYARLLTERPNPATLALQRRKKAAPKASVRPLQYSRIERGIRA